MKKAHFSRVLTFLPLILLSATALQADVKYSYQGKPYDFFTPPFTAGESLSGYLITSSVLPANLFDVDVESYITSYWFSDGVDIWTPSNSFIVDSIPSHGVVGAVGGFQVSTDPSSNITDWALTLATEGGINDLYTCGPGGIGLQSECGGGFVTEIINIVTGPNPVDVAGAATSADSVGTWSFAATPEPVAGLPAMMGLLLAGALVLKRKQAAR